MSDAITYFLSLCLTMLGLVMVLLALDEGNQSHVIAGWLVVTLGISHGVMSEFFKH